MTSLCFVMGVYLDEALAIARLPILRLTYPSADILVIADGGYDPQLQQVCEHINAPYILGQRLKTSVQGGLWLSRFFNAYLSYSRADCVIKLDPDSQLLRPFSSFPSGEVAGTLCQTRSGGYVNSSCMLVKRAAVRRLVDSDLLFDAEYSQDRFAYQRYQPPYRAPHESPRSERLIGCDLVLADVAVRLGWKSEDWPEVCCYPFREWLAARLAPFTEAEIPEKFAVIHPVKS